MQDIIDRVQITDLLHLYARGIDRCDLELLHRIWWPEAQADYGTGFSSAREWCSGVVPMLETMERTQHVLSNILITLDGDSAEAETYCTAYHALKGASGPQDMIIAGRYLDQFERRDGEWRISRRRYIMDWNSNRASAALWSGGIYDALLRRGGRKPDDPLYSGV